MIRACDIGRDEPWRRLRLAIGCLALIAQASCHSEPDYEGRALVDWYALLASQDAATRAHAADIVAREAPEHPETLRRLLDALVTESDSSVHTVLAGALAEVVRRSGHEADVREPLIKLTKDSHETVRIAAGTALARAVAASRAPLPQEVVSALMTLLDDKNYDVRAGAAAAIGILGEARPSVGGVFSERLGALVLQDRIFWVRLQALEAFTKVPTVDSTAVQVYRRALQEDWPDMETLALRGMIRSPGVARVFADSLVRFISSDDPATRRLAAQALGIASATERSPRIIAALERATSDPDTSVQSAAREALAHHNAGVGR